MSTNVIGKDLYKFFKSNIQYPLLCEILYLKEKKETFHLFLASKVCLIRSRCLAINSLTYFVLIGLSQTPSLPDKEVK